MKNTLGLAALALSTLVLTGCGTSTTPTAAKPESSYLVGSYQCEVNTTSGGFSVKNLYQNQDIYIGNGTIDVREDGTWEITPSESEALHTKGTWSLDGTQLTVKVPDSGPKKELTIPSFPATNKTAASGVPVIIKHEQVREATVLDFSMTISGSVVVTNNKGEQLFCAKS